MNQPDKRPFLGRRLDIFPSDFVCFDIETTGFSPQRDDIIEISAIKINDDKVTDTFSELIAINRPLPPFIRSLTGITDEMLTGGGSAESVLCDFLNFSHGYIVMGHNVRFDVNFVYDKALEKLGAVFDNDYVDTLSLSRRILTSLKHRKLDDIADALGVEGRTLHRALGDVEMTVKCFYKMKELAEIGAVL